MYSLSKFKLIVALLSPNSFFAVTLYLPASSTVTLFISSDAKYDWPSCLSIVCCLWRDFKYAHNNIKIIIIFIHTFGIISIVFFNQACNMRTISGEFTLWRLDSLTSTALWDHTTDGFGSALILHSNNSRLPSSSCRMAGFLANVGATPSICLCRNIGMNV